MAAAEIPELPEGGVEITQVFEASTPVSVIPTLTPCIVGACYEIREVLNDDGTLNSDVLVSGPAIATAPLDESSYTAMTSKTLTLRVNGGLEQTFTMPAQASMTAQQVVTAINGAAVAPVGFAAYVYTDNAGLKYVELRTTSAGEDQTIQITGGTLLSPAPSQLGFGIGYTFYGLGSYRNWGVVLKQASFPDPRLNLTELNIDEDSIRTFLDVSTATLELLRSESFLRRGIEQVGPLVPGLTAFDDGDGDTTSPYIDVKDVAVVENLLAAPTHAIKTGSVDLSTQKALHNTTLIVAMDGDGPQTVQLVGNPVVSEAVGALFPYTGTITMTVNGQTGIVANIVAAADLAGLVTQINADADIVALGVGAVAFASDADGNAGATHLGLLVGGVPATPVANTEVIVTAESGGAMFLVASCPYRQMLGQSGAGPRDDVATQINRIFPATIATYNGANQLVITSTRLGAESVVWVDANSTAEVILGISSGYTYGEPFRTRIGDYLYGDGEFLGIITEINPGAVAGRVRLDREVSKTGTWNRWYIVAKNLSSLSATWGISVPTPDLWVDTSGNAHIKHSFLRDTDGAPASGALASMYVAYTALRLDVTAAATTPELLSFTDTDALEEALGPVIPANPLAYGIFCAMGNAAGSAICGLGVDEVTDSAPYGTLDAFTDALDFLETREVYAIALMTDQLDVISVAKTHVDAMSEPAAKLERIALGYFGVPTRAVDDIVVSGTDGDTVAAGVFNTKKAGLSSSLLALGVDPASITVADGVFIDLANTAGHWNVTGVVTDGTKLTVNTTFTPGQNDDDFYQEAPAVFPTAISETFSVYVRGAAITDRDEEVAALYYKGHGIADRRVRIMQLDQLRASVDGVASEVEGFFACAARAGMLCGLHPAQPLTGYPVAVFTGVTGTKDRYTPRQLNQIAAGGLDIWIQDKAGAPVKSRRQLTTDLTSIETCESSIQNAVDYTAKFLRAAFKPFVGPYNITQPFMDTMNTVGEGARRFLVDEAKVLAGLDILSLEQSATNPDRLRIRVRLHVWYPCNAIEITLYI